MTRPCFSLSRQVIPLTIYVQYNATRIKSGREIADTPRAISEGDKKKYATFVQRDGVIPL